MFELPAVRDGRPLVVVLQTKRKKVKEIVVTPVKNGAFLNSKPAPIPFISLGRVGIGLFHLHRQMEKLPPNLLRLVQQFRTDAVVHYLKEAPLPASL